MGWIPDETPILESVFRDIADVDDIPDIFGTAYDLTPLTFEQLWNVNRVARLMERDK